MKAEGAAAFDLGQVSEEKFERVAHTAKGKILPRYIRFGKQLHFETFRTWFEIQIEQLRAIEQMHLMNRRQVNQRKQPLLDGDVRPSFLDRFALGGVGGGFIIFHEAARQRPQTGTRLDRAAAQHDLRVMTGFPNGDRANDQFRILVVDRAAVRTDVARQVIVRRDIDNYRMSALRTEFHDRTN